jgi:hypothetical protein
MYRKLAMQAAQIIFLSTACTYLVIAGGTNKQGVIFGEREEGTHFLAEEKETINIYANFRRLL